MPVEVFDREAATPKSSRTGLPSDGPSNYYAEIGSRYFLPERRVQPTIAAMGAIADHLAGLAGRKNLIWLSGSFPISTGLGKTLVSTSRVSDASNFEGALERLSHTLSNSNIAVYAVAAAGVAAPDTAIDGNISTIGTYAPYGGESNNEENRNEFLPDTRFNMTMSQIAAWTGGLPAMSNDLTDNISRAFKDGRDYYVVAFYAEHWDGQFHRLKVTVDRRGAHARTRMGYFAADDAELNADAKLQAVSRQVTPTAEIPLDVIATQSMLGGQTNVLIRVEALGAALAFDKAQAGWTAHARLRFIQLDSSGGPILEVDQMLDMHLSEQNHRDALASVVRFTTPVALKSGASKLRVLLQDQATGRIGAVTIPVSQFPETH